MSNQKKNKTYEHKFSNKWEKQFTWITASKNGATYFYCKACNSNLKGGLAAVKKHDGSQKHIEKMTTIKSQVPITQALKQVTSSEKKVKELEIRIASFIVEHNIAYKYN